MSLPKFGLQLASQTHPPKPWRTRAPSKLAPVGLGKTRSGYEASGDGGGPGGPPKSKTPPAAYRDCKESTPRNGGRGHRVLPPGVARPLTIWKREKIE